ncbi:MAG: peptidoglycan DD-metalloendopeptidase family protein [Chloroflexi bacterium]|nr:peptidoglycan DD-metalloendopeptidase family protein [Chloroflexota bacterium]
MAFIAVGVTATGALGRVAPPFVSADVALQEAVSESPSVSYLRPPVVLATSSGIYIVNPEPQQTEPEEATLEAAPEATPEPTPEPQPEPQPAFIVYTVQLGDSVASIAAAFGIDVEYILWNNTDLYEDPDLLLVGQKLQIPSVNGLVYNVRLGDTLSGIASFYQIDVPSILAFVPNEINSADTVIEGMVLVLPGATPPPPPIPAAVTAVEATNPEPEPELEPELEPEPAPPPPPPASIGYVWPFSGSISSYFGEYRGGSSYHLAIDIDAFGRYGAPVVAASTGTVVLTASLGWGLGTYIVIRHADGSETIYAHLAAIYVAQGQVVGQGEQIGTIGCTGYCTGAHLHFELWIGGLAVNPLSYLP